MKIWHAVAACLMVAGCAGTDAQLRSLESGNSLQVEPSQSKDYDYVVRLKNVIDIGYDPEKPEDRNEIALRAMRKQCANPRIVGEKIIETGQYLAGRAARDYFIQIKC